MLGRQEAREVLVDEEEVEELAIRDRYRNEPRRGDGQQQCQSTGQMKALPDAPVTVQQ